MSALALDTVTFSYGSTLVLDRVSMRVSDNERAFLIGPNGVGKSTLLKIVTGQLTPDSGHVSGCPQQSVLPDPVTFPGTVEDFLDAALAPLVVLKDRFERATEALSTGTPRAADEYDRALSQMNAADVWSLPARMSETLWGLGLTELAEGGRERLVSTLSPGQRARLGLAALLVLRPEVLVLDEPTNHLDAPGLAFLAHTVRDWTGPVLATSHDRAFIDDVATVIYDMDVTVWHELARAEGDPAPNGLYRNAGTYSDYLASKASATAAHRSLHAAQQAHKRQLKEHRHESMAIARGGARVEEATRNEKKFFTDRAAKTAVGRTRRDDVALERLAAHEVRKPRTYPLQFPTVAAGTRAGLAVSAREARVTGRLAPVSIDVDAGEHLLVTGDNGCGKSTLLSWIATGVPPEGAECAGALSRDTPVGWVRQRLPREGDPGFDAHVWRAGLGEQAKGIIHPSLWSTPIPELSAGNQRRAQLTVALATAPSLLVIDEPTNYLDLDTMNALESALGKWAGTLIVASHDRWLIEHWSGRRLHLEAPATTHS